MTPGSSPHQGDVIENGKDDVQQTAASVPAEMEGAVVKREAEESTAHICPTVLPPTIFPTVLPPTLIGPGPGDVIVASSGGSGAQPDSTDSDVSVRASVDDLVEAHDRNN